MLLFALACAAAPPAQLPSALWRFEDATSLGKDSAQAPGFPLSITGPGAMLATRALNTAFPYTSYSDYSLSVLPRAQP